MNDPSANGCLQGHHTHSPNAENKQRIALMLLHTGHASGLLPLVTHRLMNSRLVLSMEEPIGPQEPCVLATFCLDTHKQLDTSGVLGAQTLRKGRWSSGLRTAPPINMRKEGEERRGTGTLSLFFPFYRD